MTSRWRIAVDTGGTFTDCVALTPRGDQRVLKVLSSGTLRCRVLRDPHAACLQLDGAGFDPAYELRGLIGLALRGEVEGNEPRVCRAERRRLTFDRSLDGDLPSGRAAFTVELRASEPAALLAVRLITGTPAGAPLPPMDLRLATTRATNALLERRGARCALLVTRGFGDLLLIGDQRRPQLFALSWPPRQPLPVRIDEVDERVSAAGEVLCAPNRDEIVARARALRSEGIDSVGIALMHAWRRPDHERTIAQWLREAGIPRVICSSDGDQVPGYLPRMETAAAEAFLAPLMHDFLAAVAAPLQTSVLFVMTSTGALRRSDRYRATDGLLSGPAAGALGAWQTGVRHGEQLVIGFDMGGTSTDVCRLAGGPAQAPQHTVGDTHIAAPATAIETVAAGGGSICGWRHGLMCVGPESAGAEPGPAAYGRGGPLTLTDVNVLCGHFDVSAFGMPLDLSAVERAFEEFLNAGGEAVRALARDEVLEALLAIADERMAAAIERISLRRGLDPSQAVLVAFGGAGGQHACAVAERLSISKVILPHHASVLSADGLRGAVPGCALRRAVLAPLATVRDELPALVHALLREASAQLWDDGAATSDIEPVEVMLRLRRRGQEEAIEIPWSEGMDIASRFVMEHEAAHGFAAAAESAEVESVRVAVRERGAGSAREHMRDHDVCAPGEVTDGPATLPAAHTTLVLPKGWRAERDRGGDLIITRKAGSQASGSRFADRSPLVQQTLLMGRLEAIGSEMGARLQHAAVSSSIRERLDFSCAVLDANADLLVSAPHVPVHLGALGLCVRTILEAGPLVPGEAIVVNHPAFGGSHLPDITVVMAVHGESGALIGYAAVRAHHAEIGGRLPGSMPPDATCLEEEGVVLAPQRLAIAGRLDAAPIEKLLRSARYPSRAVEDNLVDLAAQYAAVRQGEREIRKLAAEIGEEIFLSACRDLQDRAEAALESALREREGVSGEASSTFDDGSVVRAAVRVFAGRATIDFTGSSPPHPGNLNATPAIVRAAVLYVLRLLTDADLPLAEGMMRRIDLRVPTSMLNPPLSADPRICPAVVGGNVETSQRVVEVLLRALGLSAAAQGTMNNVLFGDASFGHYETIGGGSGAGPGFDGPSATHVHMTNTKITDPEILECRFPVRLERFAVRRGSGGQGTWSGGDGLIRAFRFLRPLSVSLLAQHRTHGPPGMHGGADGRPGVHRVMRAAGVAQVLPGAAAFDARTGDVLEIETPGGGGWGQYDHAHAGRAADGAASERGNTSMTSEPT